jgi:putative restriction endonuclease
MVPRRLTHAELERIDRAVEESGLEVLHAEGHRPRRLDVRLPGSRKQAKLIVYVWAIQSGGGGPGVRPEDERRVQPTRARGADFVVEPGATTLLLGYDPVEDMYAAWDFALRRWTRNPPGHPSGAPVRSPSAQTRQSKLDEAQRAGVAFYAHDIDARQRNGSKVRREELVANFRPDHFGAYLTWLSPTLVPGGVSAPARAVKRRRIATERLARDARFTKAVVVAYGERCCFCGFGGGVVEAAHIKPVSDGGPDDVRNGVALCPTHHRLFDKGYVLISAAGLDVAANDKKMRAQRVSAPDRARVAAGLASTPHWPGSGRMRPDPKFIRRHRVLHR